MPWTPKLMRLGPPLRRLLAAGHTVHATARDPTREDAVGHLKALPGADTRLKLFKADLLVEGSFDEALQVGSMVMGCMGCNAFMSVSVVFGLPWVIVTGHACCGRECILLRMSRFGRRAHPPPWVPVPVQAGT